MARRKPAQLSGGQQQRVALARAIVNRPAVLLLDEPLGALDLKLRRQMQIELKRIQTEVGLTFVHVTHDQEEAMTMADTIAVMNAGRIEQLGGPAELYESPDHDVRRQLPRPVQPDPGRGDRAPTATTSSSTSTGRRSPCPPPAGPAATTDLLIGVRPEKIQLVPEEAAVDGARPQRRCPAASSPTRASPGSARSTSSGCRGARS